MGTVGRRRARAGAISAVLPNGAPRGATAPRRSLASGAGRCACRARAPPLCRRLTPHCATAATCWVRSRLVNARAGQSKSRATRYTASDQCEPRRSTSQPPPLGCALPASRALSLANPIAHARVTHSLRAGASSHSRAARRSQSTRSARRGRSPARHAWRVGLCVVHRGRSARSMAAPFGLPRRLGWLGQSSVRSSARYRRFSRTDTPRFATVRRA